MLTTAVVSGWFAAFLAVVGETSTAAMVGVMVASIAVGVLAFFLVRGWLGRRLAPVLELSRVVRDAATRPRDHIAMLRAGLGGARKEISVAVEAQELREALSVFLDRVEQRHQRQTAWIGAVVHDLKTPLAASANALAAIAATDAMRTSPEGSVVVHVAVELRELVADVQRMLDTVKFEREDFRIARDPVDIRHVIDDIVRRREIDGAPVLFTVSGHGVIVGDRALIERAIDNLLVNASRYARSRVSVEVFPGCVRVADDGTGLPAPIEHLTQPFRSEPIEVAGVTVAGGAGGIGLFLARRVFELHGGRLVVESTSSKGTALLAYFGTPRHG